MERAIELAKKSIGFTSPNPAVGAVVVKAGKIIGEGYHARAGGEHAEIVAMRNVPKSQSLKGSALYVTLEPCCHSGKTPPCTDAIIAAGIKKVVYGMRDPFKKVNGKGDRALRKAGIQIEQIKKNDPLYNQIRELNQSFIKWATTRLPFVTLKAGMSLDGKIATKKGISKWITSEDARKDARVERSKFDAIIVGAGTVAADNPELAAHGIYAKKKLLRVIIDPELSSRVTSKVFRDEHVFVATTERAPEKNRKKFEKKGVEYKIFGETTVSISKLLFYLGSMNILSVYVEGGSSVHGSFVDAALKDHRMIDQLLFYIAPKIIGGAKALPVIGGEGASKPDTAINCAHIYIEQIGNDIKARGMVNWY